MRCWEKLTMLGLLAGFTPWNAARADTQAAADIASGAGTYYPYHYDVTLHNTGTTDINTFWFAWDDSGLNFLPDYPYLVNAPSGWSSTLIDNTGVSNVEGWSIEWYNYSGQPIAPGQSSSDFSFESYDAPDVIAGISPVPPIHAGDSPFPVATSFVYDTYPAQQDPGFQFVAGAPAAAPEPGTLGILGAVAAGLLVRRRRA